MAMPNFVLALSTVADTAIGFDKLCFALREIDTEIQKGGRNFDLSRLSPPIVKCSIREALESDIESIPTEFSVGKISADFVYAYPPGCPLIAPGEVVTASALYAIKNLENCGAAIYSSFGNSKKISVKK